MAKDIVKSPHEQHARKASQDRGENESGQGNPVAVFGDEFEEFLSVSDHGAFIVSTTSVLLVSREPSLGVGAARCQERISRMEHARKLRIPPSAYRSRG